MEPLSGINLTIHKIRKKDKWNRYSGLFIFQALGNCSITG